MDLTNLVVPTSRNCVCMLSSLSTADYYLHKYDFMQEHAKFGLLGILMMANEIKKKRIIQFSDFAKVFKRRKEEMMTMVKDVG